MPACKDCKHLRDGVCAAPRGRRKDSPIRLCINAIAHEWADRLQGKILEIGYGKNRLFRKLVAKHDAEWAGVDPRWDEGSATDIKHPDGSMDAVVAIQCLEHFDEHAEALEEIYRVLKPGGLFLFNVPMLSHGNDLFVTANCAEIVRLFDERWDVLKEEHWRREHAPLPVFEAWKPAAYKKIKRHFAACGQEEPSVWVYEVIVRKIDKDRALPGMGALVKNFSGALGRVVMAAAKGEQVYADDLTKEARRAICRMCDLRIGSRCSHVECGCFINEKTKYATEECPDKHW